jgi:hypothetical protein
LAVKGATAEPRLVTNFAFAAREWDTIDVLRETIAMLCERLLNSVERASGISMTAHELMENAAKYSLSPDALVHCCIYLQPSAAVVTVANEADPSCVAVLHEELAIINEGDPLEMYVDKMRQSLEEEGSRLGLARIRSEGGAKLDVQLLGSSVLVSALFDTSGLLPDGDAEPPGG